VSPRVLLQSRWDRRRAALVSAARSGAAASAARTSARTASASRFCASSSATACAAASRRPLRRPDHRSDSHVPSATTGLNRAKNRNVGVCNSHAMSTPPTAGRATATHANRRRGGGSGGRGKATSTSARGLLKRCDGRTYSRPPGPGSTAAAGPPGPVTVTALAPSRTIAPVGQLRGCSSSGSSPSQLPLVDPRSATVMSPPPTCTTTCRRDTSGSSRRTVASLPRPRTWRPWPRATVRPASGPPTTCSSRALDRCSAAPRATGRPTPRTAPCATSGAVSGRSGSSRVDPDHRALAGTPRRRLTSGSTVARQASSSAVSSTSAAPAAPTSVQRRVARDGRASDVRRVITGRS
jgi:hypothetical protein